MSILRLSTVALTLVLFTMGALILPVNTALAHCKGSHKQIQGCDTTSHPHESDDSGSGGDPAVYYRAIWDGEVGGTSDGNHPVKVSDWIAGNKKLIGLNIGGGHLWLREALVS